MKGVQMKRLLIVFAMSPILGMCGQGAVAGTLEVVHSIELHGQLISGRGLTWDGQLLWATGAIQQYRPLDDGIPYDPYPYPHTYAHGYYPSDGSLKSYLIRSSALYNASGFVWNGNHFWIATFGEVIGMPVDTAVDLIYKISDDGAQVDVVQAPLSPDARPSGIAWDGTHLWLSDRRHDKIMQVDPADMSVTSSFDSPGGEPRGLTWDGSSLWSVDGSSDLIYQIDPSGEVIETWTGPVTAPWGITYDGEYLWVLDNDSRKIYQLTVPEPSTLALLVIGGLSISAFFYRGRKNGC